MPLLLKSEVPPKTSSAELCRKLFAADHCCDNFSFGRAAFSQPLSGVRMKSDLHYFATRILIYELAWSATALATSSVEALPPMS